MKKLSKKIAKKIPFSKLSKPEKRIAIAKDVLAQIKRQKYIPNAGAYIKYIDFIEGIDDNDMNEKDIKSNFNKIKECTVCALGACLMSATKFANKLEFCDIGHSATELDNNKVKELFSSIFSPLQLLMIEIAFEGSDNGSRVDYFLFNIDSSEVKKVINKSENFYGNYENDEARMIGIMKNIISNKGTFKP